MAHAYTPGLRVTERTRISKVRRLPLKGQVLVGKGTPVLAETVVARTELPGNVQPVKAASILGVSPQDLLEYMLKKEGDAVEKDEIIARSRSFFGLFNSKVLSPCSGKVESVSIVTGQVILREPPIPVEVQAYIDGVVTSVLEGEGVVVEAEGAFIQGIFGVGGEVYGSLVTVVDDPSVQLTPDRLRPEHRGKVVVGGSRVDRATIDKARELGIRAIVVGGLDDQDLRAILGYDLGVAITGHEQLGVTVVVTEGFGTMSMATRTFDLLRRFEGKKVSVNGATQIRAGVMRPEIVIPLTSASLSERAAEEEPKGLGLGSPIRVIRMPHFGRLGEVIALPHELQPLETEAKVRVLRVRFQEGEEATLPRANVEAIET